MMQPDKIVVCGATGNQGGAVVRALLQRSKWTVIALTRDPDAAAALLLQDLGAVVIRADLQDMPSLVNAFAGAYGVFGLTQPWNYSLGKFDKYAEMRQAKNIIWACRECGIRQLIFSTVLNVSGQRSGVSWIDNKLQIERLLKDHLPFTTVIRPALYLENLGDPLLSISDNMIKGRFGADRKVPYITLADVGEFVAQIFDRPEEYSGRKISLAGQLLDGHELAALLSSAAGKRVFRYIAVNALYLRLFHPDLFRMRRFFELQGELLDSDLLPDDNTVLFSSAGVRDLMHKTAERWSHC